jgi:hypothetical protein
VIRALPAQEGARLIKVGLAEAMDGEVIARNRAAPVRAESDGFLLQRLKGSQVAGPKDTIGASVR